MDGRLAADVLHVIETALLRCRERIGELFDALFIVRRQADMRCCEVCGPFHKRRLNIDGNLDADRARRHSLLDMRGFAHGSERRACDQRLDYRAGCVARDRTRERDAETARHACQATAIIFNAPASPRAPT